MSKLQTAALARAQIRAAEPALRRYDEELSGTRQHYALNPFALADEGLVTILDLETLQRVPLKLWPHQREVVTAWVDLEYLAEHGRPRFRNLHEEKSRQMGLTWVIAYVIHWALSFHETSGLALSQKLGEVCDSGPTTDSFFGKIKFIWEHLPPELRAPLIFTGGNDPSIRNPLFTNGFLAGEGATLDPGRGGRYDYIFLDEAARIPWGRVVQTAVTRACPSGRLYNSTPNGEDALYFWLRDTRPAGYTFLRHHWSLNPVYARGLHFAAYRSDSSTGEIGGLSPQATDAMLEAAEKCVLCQGTIDGLAWDASNPRSHRFPGRLTSPWYEAAIVELTDEQVAQELDIDYAGSLPARVYTEFTEERNVIPHIPYDPNLPLELSWDYGWSMNAVGIWQDAPGEYRKIGEFEAPDLLPEQVVAGVIRTLRELGVEERNLSPHNTLTWLCIGDPAGEATQMATGRPLTADYRRAGFAISSRMRNVDQTIIAVKRLLMGRPKVLLVSGDTCPGTVRHFKMNKWETDRVGVRKPNAKLVNDEHNHMLRADAYLITHKFPPPTVDEGLEAVRRRGEETGRLDPDLSYDTKL